MAEEIFQRFLADDTDSNFDDEEEEEEAEEDDTNSNFVYFE